MKIFFIKYNFSSHFSVLLRLKNNRFPLDSAISPRGNGICAEASAPESPQPWARIFLK